LVRWSSQTDTCEDLKAHPGTELVKAPCRETGYQGIDPGAIRAWSRASILIVPQNERSFKEMNMDIKEFQVLEYRSGSRTMLTIIAPIDDTPAFAQDSPPEIRS
jgi:hypothetical protein